MLALMTWAGAGLGQQLFDFETDLEGWAPVTFPEAGQAVTAMQSAAVATTGSGSMAVTKTPDSFSWTVQISASTGTMYAAFTDALNDGSNAYELVFDMIFRAADLPGAGGTTTTYINSLVAMSSDLATNDVGGTPVVSGGWSQTADAFGLGGDDIQALTDTHSLEVRIPIGAFNLTPNSSYYEMTLSLNGNYGSNATATVYYDNFRLEASSPVFFDFSSGLDGWTFDELCGDVGLAVDVPTAGEQSLQLLYTDFGQCRAGVVTKGPGDGHPMYRLIRDAVRDNPADYNLEFDLILRAADLPGGATFVRPLIVFSGDDGMSWQQMILTDNEVDLTTITGDTVLPMKVPLDTWLWPANGNWDPTYIQMALGTEVDDGGNYSFYFDNFAIRPLIIVPPPPIVINGLSVGGGTPLSLSWASATDAVYAVSMATDPSAGWSVIASNLVAEPPVNTYTDYMPSASAEYYRVEQMPGGVTISLFDFEGGTDGWAPSGAAVMATNSDVAVSHGTNSLAVTFPQNPYWRVNWTSAEYELTNAAYASIRNALLDTNQTWYIAADFIYDGPGINATNSTPPGWINQQVAFNSPENGWQDQFTNLAPLNGGQIQALATNQTVITWGVRLSETGWGTATNSWYQMNFGVSTDWANMSEVTVYYDNIRLTTEEP